MQNRYVGDVGDFGKYGLLRWLTGMTGPEPNHELRLGVVWQLNHDDSVGGKRRDYSQLLKCDRWLYLALNHARISPNPAIRMVQEGGILPVNTRYFGNCRCAHANRPDWLADALDATENVRLVFVDPDKGIKLEEYQDNNDSPQHTYLSDLERFFRRGNSLVVYQHIGQGLQRGQDANDFLEKIRRPLRDRLNPAEIWTLRWHRVIPRAYFVIAQPGHEGMIWNRIHSFLTCPHSLWGEPVQAGFNTPHFALVP